MKPSENTVHLKLARITECAVMKTGIALNIEELSGYQIYRLVHYKVQHTVCLHFNISFAYAQFSVYFNLGRVNEQYQCVLLVRETFTHFPIIENIFDNN